MKRIVILAAALAWGQAGAIPTPVNPLYNLTDLQGGPFKTALLEPSAGRDQKVLVYFWATWCSTCEVKLMKTLPEWKAAKGIQVLTVNTDKDNDKVRHYLSKREITLPVAKDESREFLKSLRILSMPSWAVYKVSAAQWSLIDSAGGFDEDRVLKAIQN